MSYTTGQAHFTIPLTLAANVPKLLSDVSREVIGFQIELRAAGTVLVYCVDQTGLFPGGMSRANIIAAAPSTLTANAYVYSMTGLGDFRGPNTTPANYATVPLNLTQWAVVSTAAIDIAVIYVGQAPII